MRMHKNEVTFDTCGCQVQLQRDLDIPQSPQEFMHFLKKCPAHAQMEDPEAWGKCWTNPDSEQHRKNNFYKRLTVEDPTGLGAGLVERITRQKMVMSEFFGTNVGVFDSDGSPVMDERYEVIGGTDCYVFCFDANRCCCICFRTLLLSDAKKAELQAYCDATWGAGTVRVMNASEEP